MPLLPPPPQGFSCESAFLLWWRGFQFSGHPMLVGDIFACTRQRGLPVCEGWAVVDDASAARRPCPVQGAFAMGSTELPASAPCGCWGVRRQAVDLVERSLFTASGRCSVNALLPTCESLGWVPLCFGTGPGGIRHVIDPELPAAGFPALCKREAGGTTEDALHELLRPVVIEELPSRGCYSARASSSGS